MYFDNDYTPITKRRRLLDFGSGAAIAICLLSLFISWWWCTTPTVMITNATIVDVKLYAFESERGEKMGKFAKKRSESNQLVYG